MSTIDNRVVRMEFDNKQFEQGVSTTLGTLSKLKEALNFKKGNLEQGMSSTLSTLSKFKDALSFKKGNFDELQQSVNSVSFDPLSNQISVVQQKFSLLGELARTVFDRISNKIVDTATTMGKMLTIDPITDGFGEYGLKMGSIQTIMAGTGESLETVNAYLDDLNTYADKTIYSFSDMTQSIGKFTNAGVKLPDAVDAIKGISNEAAVSGANTNEASRAMYNFAQALSSGSVKLMDWRSIELANMGTKEFKEQLIDTAVAMGTLRQEGDKYISTTTDLNGKVSDAFNATSAFNDSLAHQWLTNDVLVETLSHYAKDIRAMTYEERLAYEEKLRGIGYTEEQIEAIKELGQKANDSSQDVKTFNQLVDTVKEGLGSGWATSFEHIFGNFEEAKKLWTGVKDEIEDVLNPIADARNEMLKFWHDAEKGGRSTMIEAIGTAWNSVKTVMGTLEGAFQKVFPPITGETLVNITNTIADMANKFKLAATNTKNLSRISDIAKGVFNTFKMAGGAVSTFWNAIKPLRDVLGEFAVHAVDAAAAVGRLLTGMANSGNPFKYIVDGLNGIGWGSLRLNDVVDSVVAAVEGLVKGLLDLVGIHLEGNPITDFVDKLRDFAGKNLSFPSFDTLKNALQGIKDAFSAFGDMASGGINGVLSGIGGIFDNLFGAFGGAADKVNAAGDAIGNVTKSVGTLDNAKGILDGFVSFVSSMADIFIKVFTTIADYLPKAFDYLASGNFEKLVNSFIGIMTGSLVNSIRKFVDMLTSSKANVKKGGFFDLIDSLKGSANKAVEAFAEVLVRLSEALTAFTNSINAGAILKAAIGVGVLVASLAVLASLDATQMANGIAGIAAVMAILIAGFKGLDFGSGMVAAQGINLLSTSLIKMAIAIGILSIAAAGLSQLSLDQLAVGLIGIAAAMGIMVIGVSALANFGGSIEATATAMIGLSIAIGILSIAVKAMSSLSWEKLAVGLSGVGGLLAELVVFSRLIDGDAFKVSSAVSILLLAAALNVLASAVSYFASIDTGQLEQGLLGVGALLGEVAIFSRVADTDSLSVSSALSIVLLAAALKVLESSVTVFAGMDWNQLKQGLKGIGILLFEISAFSTIMNGLSMSLSSLVGLVVVVQTISVLSSVVKSLGEMSDSSLDTALTGLGVSLVTLVAALKVLGMGSGNMIAGAAALTVLSVALRVLLPVLQAFSGFGAAGVAASLVTLAGALAILAVAGVGFGAISGAMLTGAAALAAFGAACVVAGVGILAVGTGLATLGAGIAAFGAALVMNAGGIASSLQTLGDSIGASLANAIISFVTTFTNRQAEVIAALATWIHAIGDFITGEIPYIMGIGVAFFTSFFQMIAAQAPQLSNSVGQLIAGLLTALVAWIPPISNTLLAGVITLANSVANGIRDNGPQILAAIRNILSSMIELVLTALADIVRLIPAVGPSLADGIEGAKDVVREHLAPETLEGAGKDAMAGATAGVEAGAADLQNASANAAQGVEGSFKDALPDGAELVSGLTDGMVASLQGAGPELGSTGEMNLQSYLDQFSNIDLASNAGTEVGDANLAGILSVTPWMSGAGSEELNAYLAEFGNTDLASMSGAGMALAGADGALSQSDAYTGAADAAVSSYDSVLAGADAYSSGAAMTESGAAGAGANSAAYAGAANTDASAFLSALGLANAQPQGTAMAQTGAEAAAAQQPSYIDAANVDAEGFTSTLGAASASPQGASLGGSGASGASGTYGSYSTAGGYVAGGFNWGVASPYAKAQASAKGAELAKAALDSIKATIAAASPSKVTKQYGRWVSEGFAIGIEELSDYAKRSGSRLGQKTVDALAVSAEAIADYAKMDYEIDPTIRPVLDLTEIQNGISKANGLIDGINGSVSLGFGEMSYARGIYGGIGTTMLNPVDEIMRTLNDKLSNMPTEVQREGDVNVYINDAIVNGDAEIQTAVLTLFDTLTRKGAMNVGQPTGW